MNGFERNERLVRISQELDDPLRSTVPHVRFIRRTRVPRWATEEPEPSDDENGGEPDSEEDEVPRLIPLHKYVTGGTPQAGEDEPIEEEERSIVESTYNEQGYLTLQERFESETLIQRVRFAYDGDMRLVRKVTEDPIGENTQTEERFYNADGKIAKQVITYSNGSQMVTQHLWNGNEEDEVARSEEGIEGHRRRRYDSEGRVVERMEIDPETNEATGAFTTYDAKGQLVEAGVIDADGSRWVHERTTYNDDGTEDTVLTLDAEGNEIERKVSTYENGDCVRQIVTDAEGETCTDNTFDDSHRIIRAITIGPGSEWEGIWEYDERGLISASAIRSMEDRGFQRQDRLTIDTRTTWWEYECYEA